MKKKYSILLFILLILAGGITWWQLNKKSIVRHAVEKGVAKGTDSTYYIHYDSSRIDALAGNAVFYNISLQSDSLQKKLYTDDTTGLSKQIFNVRIKKLEISGADIISFLQKNKIAAKAIEITEPVITIINTGKREPVKLSSDDSLALYEKLTGRFNSIQAGEIKINNGTLAFAKGKKDPHTILQGINIDLKDLRIDSTRNYDNIISYFIKDIIATVKTATVKDEAGRRFLRFENVEYNAPRRFLKVDRFVQKNISDSSVMISLSENRVAGLSTSAFIMNRQLTADSLSSAGGELHLLRRTAKSPENIDLNNGFFDEAIVKNILLGKTTVYMKNCCLPNDTPVVLKNLRFRASGIDSIYAGTNIMNLIAKSNWELSADGISFLTADKVYKVNIGPFVLDELRSLVNIKEITVISPDSWEKFAHALKFQKNFFHFRFNNIRSRGVDLKKLLADKSFIAEEVSLQPVLEIFNDRTIPADTASNMGGYPHQLLQKLKCGIYIKTLHAENALVDYKETGAASKKTGDVIFKNLQGTITNITNIESYKKKNNVMGLTAKGSLGGIADITTSWKLSLEDPHGSFDITGQVGPFSGPALNPVAVPLGMGKIQSGNAISYSCNMHGTDLRTEGECRLIYNDLKIKLLKNTGDSNNLRKRTTANLFANIVLHNKNPKLGFTRTGDMGVERKKSETFFYLIWKSIFAGVKSSVTWTKSAK